MVIQTPAEVTSFKTLDEQAIITSAPDDSEVPVVLTGTNIVKRILKSNFLLGLFITASNTLDDIIDGATYVKSENNYTDADSTVVGNTSGTNTGDQVISDATISTTDITTNNVSSVKHGFAPKGDGTTTKYLNANGAYSTPASGGVPEGTAVLSTGETAGKVLTAVGDDSSVWATPAGGGDMLAATYDAAGIEEQLVGTTATQTLSNKTFTSPIIANFTNMNHDHSTGTEGGTLEATSISDFDIEVSNNSSVTANSAKVSYPGDADATELNILDGATVTTAELNILDGVTATAAELNILDGVTATTTELNYVDGVTSSIQDQLDDKVDSDPSAVTGADQVTNMMSLTQAEYDAITTPNASTVYYITDA